jgi:hypothetical protein
MSFGGFMCVLKRHVAVINYDPNNLVHNRHYVDRQWLLDGYPICINLGSGRTTVKCHGVSINQPITPDDETTKIKCWYEVTSDNGVRIKDIRLCQLETVRTSGFPRHYSESFPDTDLVSMTDDYEIIDYLGIRIPVTEPGSENTERVYPLREYLKYRGSLMPLAPPLAHPVDTLNGEPFPEGVVWGMVLS